MDIGISANFPWFGPKFTDLARHIEQLGFESIWTGEHIIVPVEIADPYRYGVLLPKNYKHMTDPFISMAAASAVTTKLKFGMDVCLVTQREPLVLAKAAATLDRISGGRLIIGAGHGWIREESEIFGIAWDERVRRGSEIIRILRTIWTEEEPSFEGEFYSFPRIYSNPKPARPEGVPLLIGAGGGRNSDNGRVLRRIAEIGDGWVCSSMTPQRMRDDLGRLRQLCAETGRDFDKMDFTLIMAAITFGLGDRPDWGKPLDPADPKELIPAFEEAGVNRIIIGMTDMADDSAFGNIEKVAKGLNLI